MPISERLYKCALCEVHGEGFGRFLSAPQNPRRSLEYVQNLVSQRALVDYALQRRSVLSAVTSGRTGIKEVCDADPYLIRAAKFHGVVTDQPCPVCRKETLTNVYWVYGDELAHAAGTARTVAELERMAGEFSEFSVYMVEVCRTCSWNHLVQSFVLGHEGERTPKRRSGIK